MVEEPENTPETPVEPEPVLVRIEVDAQKALQTIEGFLPAAEGRLHQELDAWWAEVVLNVGSSIPTAIHNQQGNVGLADGSVQQLSNTGVHEALVSCALERYRLADGHLPDTLDALVPPFLSEIPHDVIDGQPLRYHRTAVDQYVLYSIGWNEKDDGGVVALKKDSTGIDIGNGDWVWKY